MADLILAVLREPGRARNILDAADRLAGLAGAGWLTALAVREPIHVPALAAEELAHEADEILAAKNQEGRRIAALEEAFREWVDANATPAAQAKWVAVEGSLAALVEERGSRADIVVAARAVDEDDHPARHAMRAALFATGRPVLAVPPGPVAAFGRRVAIAWKNDARMWKALVPALRFLDRAEEVHVMIGARNDAPPPVLSPALAERGIQAQLHVLPVGAPPFGQALLEKAHELGADMLIMGAYAHSPLREYVLGGVTRYLLFHADLPVFMRH